MTQESFEETIWELTQPINGQLPRPWMTNMSNLLDADVFIVGMNQATQYPAQDIPHPRHIDALFNRNGESCRSLYDEVRPDHPSKTRPNIDDLSARLHQRDIHNVLETDIVCYSTSKKKDLKSPIHAGGEQRGRAIFDYLLSVLNPTVVIVHGVETVKQFSGIIKIRGLAVPRSPNEICDIQTDRYLVIPTRSLAQPEFNKWKKWSGEYLDNVADRVREKLGA